jgi:demethylmenaquinone methyltransferase/2-methoxy-6-polyprenyl-1,4-benzoquinol methylase
MDRAQTASGPGDSASFGFRDVNPSEKQGLVNEVFDKVADRYDLMNDLMSGGLHRLWKGELVRWLSPPRESLRPHRVLDVAGGTGDIAFRIAARSGSADVTVLDINPSMLEVGQSRALRRELDRQVRFAAGNAEALPVEDRSVDAVTIAFGIRNVPAIDKALSEAARVLRPGGRLMVLEFSAVDIAGLDWLYETYSFRVIPRLGELIVGDAEPYRYLVESIRRFPGPERFADMLRAAGLRRVAYRRLSGGIAAIHSGWRL